METKHLNSAQKRAQSIKTELQQFDSDHLDTFIDGVTATEPPKYRRVGAKIVPDLVMASLKKGAEIYNIGNVYYQEADEVKNVSFRIEPASRRFKVDRSNRIPKGGDNFLAIPIYQFVAQEFITLWKVKYQRIIEHKDLINEKRQLAHHLFSQPPRRSVNGKAPGTQMSGYANQDDCMDNAKSRKRLSGEPVVPHPSNKRARVDLLAMSDATKCETFAKIEDKFKVELFDAMVKAAFPGFDNIMTAAWNVVTVYAVVGSEFEGLHRAMADLKAVLEEFDAAQGDGQPKAAMRQTDERDHSAVNHRNGRKAATCTPEEPMEGIIQEGHPGQGLLSLPQNDIVKEVGISDDRSEEVEIATRPTVRAAEEASDDEARKEKFAEIKRRIEAKPRYTPTQEREGSATRSDSTTEDEEETTIEHIQQPYEQDETPQEAGRAEENFDNTVSDNIPEPFDPNNHHMRLKQEEREAPKFNRMNEHERQYQHQCQQRPQQPPQEQLQSNQNGHDNYDITKTARGESRESREPRGSREKGTGWISPVDINQRSYNHNQAFDHPHAKQVEMRKPQPLAEKSKATPAVWLGASKLGAKKGTATAIGAAPVAPMMHTMQNGSQHMAQHTGQHNSQHNAQHAVRKDMNGLERRRPQ